ncbi:A-kinase anchor protein 5 [Pogoniulus pusillus]|uniref:A-kinase anchor protein 5 n=1 Tax=Pogoniulus pusillus TaxID=488313 RepID=UPI0030B95BA7
MVKATKEIQMENPGEAETHSAGATCSPPEEQAEKPSMLCFKKRKKSCKKELTVKDVCKGASEEKSQCISTDQGETKVSNQPRSSKGAWAAIKNLARPQRKQKSSWKKVSSDSQVQLEVDTEETCAQGFLKKRASSGVKMPCVRFSRGKKRTSPSEAVEESEGSGQANEVGGIVNKASEEMEDSARRDKSESFSPVSVEEDQDTVKESVSSVGKSEPFTEPTPDAEEHMKCTAEAEITSSETVSEKAQKKLQEGSQSQTTACVEGAEVAAKAPISKDQPIEGEEIAPKVSTSKDQPVEGGEVASEVPVSKDQSAAGGEIAPEAPISKDQSAAGGEVAPEAPISEDQSAQGEVGAPEVTTSKDQSAAGGEVVPEVPISKDQHVEGEEVTPEVSVSKDQSAEGGEVAPEVPISKDQHVEGEEVTPEVSISKDQSAEGGEVAPEVSISKDQPAEGGEVTPEAPIFKDQSAEGGRVAPEVSISKDQPAEGGEVTPEVPISKDQHVEGGETTPEALTSKDQPNSIPGSAELQEIPSICKELPAGDESEKSINLPEECKTEETAMDFNQSVLKDDAASMQTCSSQQVMLEANVGPGVGIIITVTEAEDSDNTDSDQGYELSPVLHRNKQKGNKKSSGSFDFGNKEGPEAGDIPQAEEKGPGDQGHKTGEQYELLLIETASSLVKAAIQSSIEQLVNEMALEQNRHNSFL